MPPKNTAPLTGSGPFAQPVVIYTRVSTDNQVGGRFDSCESQAAVCREHIERHAGEGWHEIACLTDAAYSGGTMDRPGIRTLKRMIEAGEVRIVLIYKLERVLRSTDEWVPFRAFLKKHGCRLESATEDLSESTPSGRLKNNLLMSFSQYERENTAEKTSEKMRQQAKRGLWNGGMVPYGYTYDKNTQSLRIHPEDAAVVRRIFDQAGRLVSLTDLANALNAEGLRTKERVWVRRDGGQKPVGGCKFRSDGLRLLIRNPIYRGAVKFAGHQYAGKHEAIVSAEIWDKANAATVHTEPKPIYAFRERDTHHHLLKGLAWCGSCGRALVPNDSGKKSLTGVKYRYYTCSLVMRETAAAPCPVGRLSADALEKTIIALVGEASKHPALVREMVQASQTMRRGDRDKLKNEVEQTRQALAAVDRKLANCAEAVAKGGAEVLGEALVRRATELRNERQKLLIDHERCRQELALCDATALEERGIQAGLAKLGEALPNLSPMERKELLRLFLERVEVRRHVSSSRRNAGAEREFAPEAKVFEVRIRFHLPELVRGMQERSQADRAAPRISIRGLSLEGRVDFSQAQRGEVTIVTPFRQTFRLDARVRTVPVPRPAIVHPIVKALHWQRLLDEKTVPHRFALAKRVGCTPGAVTKVLRMIKLVPEIQRYLAALRTRPEVWHFSAKRMGTLAVLPPELQRPAFDRICRNYERIRQTLVGSGQLAIPEQAAGGKSPKLRHRS